MTPFILALFLSVGDSQAKPKPKDQLLDKEGKEAVRGHADKAWGALEAEEGKLEPKAQEEPDQEEEEAAPEPKHQPLPELPPPPRKEEPPAPKKVQTLTKDFESGTLEGWSAEGTAFASQPTYGDNPSARGRGQASKHQGDWWIGTFEKRPSKDAAPGETQGDEPRGTLTSIPFPVTHEKMSFLIGGGCDLETEYAELLVDGKPVRKSTGKCDESMERASWDTAEFLGRQAQLRLVDGSPGGWGHINFDDVLFEKGEKDKTGKIRIRD